MLVEAGNGVEFLAAGLEECRPRLDADFLQRFQAVGDESRAKHVDPFDALSAKRLQHLGRVGLQPLGAAEAGLERERPLSGIETQFLARAAGAVTRHRQ